MSNIPSVKPKAVIRIAQKVGFIFDRQKGSHAVYLRASDKRRVIIPMHKKDLKTGTLHAIITDLGLTPKEFAELL